MAVNLTLYIAWDGPRTGYDTDDIIEVVPYVGSNIPPYDGAPWVHIHVLNAPWATVLEAKNFLLEPNAEDEPYVTPDQPVTWHRRKLRAARDEIPSNVVNMLNTFRTYQFDWAVIADGNIYNKKLQRLMTALDWPTE